jgi:polysaccharide biosynthesis/export protein
MNRILFFVIVFLLASMRSGLVAAADVKSNIYRLHQGDTVMISVWREDALQKQAVVLPDGSITFPLVGRVEVEGLSTPEVESRITEKLKKYLSDPVVTVVISAIDGNRAYVLGKVLKPGPFVITEPTTVLQAISIAGGFDKFADDSDIKLIRQVAPNTTQIYPVNYKDIISGRDISTNIYLKAGDTIVVP